MIMHRKGERGAVPFRSGRFFNIDNDWYFSCREGQDNGPFSNREAANDALKTYLSKYACTNAQTPDAENSDHWKNKRE